MTRWYSPRLSREVVRRLYYRAKLEGIAMTTLVNRIVQTALDAKEVVESRRDTASNTAASGEREGSN